MSLFKFLFGSKAENTPEAKKASDEKSFDVLKYDGVRALKIGQADYAVKCLRAALEISDDLECHDYLSQALMRAGDLPGAIEQVNILSEAQPENVDIYLRKADIAYMMEDYKMVGDACEKALLYDSDNALALYMYGRACMGMGDDANAVAMFTKSLAATDSFGDAMLLRGRAYLSMGDVDSAADDAEHLMRLNPDNEDVLRRSIEKAGICYLHAPLFASGMKFLGPVRKALNVPTCFNLLGPFINPCSPKNSLHGTATPTQLRLYTSMHQRIGDNYGVISSYDGYDEISLTSGFKFVTRHFEKVYTPLDMGLAYVQPTDIYGGSTAEEARRIFDNVLENKATRAQTDVVIANAACGISLMNPNLPISDTVAMARESIESGKALQCLKAFIEINS